MSEEKKEMAGWVAYHLDRERREFSFSRQGCEEKLTEVSRGDFKTFESYIATHEAELIYMKSRGWRIRPCKIVFTDEEEK